MGLQNAKIIKNKSTTIISKHEIIINECIDEVSFLSEEIFLQLKLKFQKMNINEDELESYYHHLETINYKIVAEFNEQIKKQKSKLDNYKTKLYNNILNYS